MARLADRVIISMSKWLRVVVTGWRLLRSPGELPAMVLALAAGVGLTVAAYSLVHAVLIEPLPYSEPERLVQVWEVDPERREQRVIRHRDVGVLRAERTTFGSIATHAVMEGDLVPAGGLGPVPLVGSHVSVNLFGVLGVQAAKGRTFRTEDSELAEVPPLVVSERLVRSGLVSGQLGETVELGGAAYRLIGTLPETFWFPDRRTSFWAPVLEVPAALHVLPLGAGGAYSIRSRAIARLGAGATVAEAEVQTNVRLSRPGSGRSRARYRVEGHESILRAPVKPALLVLQAGSGLVLLLVCLNVGSLFVVRGRRLRPVFVTLRGLGATTSQVVVTHLASALCVVAVAAPCAVLIGWGLLGYSLSLESGVFSRTAAPAINGHVAMVAFVVTVLACVVSCAPGAVGVARTRGTLHERAGATTRGRGDQSLLAVQAGLVFALCAQAVLVSLVLQGLVRTNVGFTKTDFLVVEVQPRRGGATLDANVQLARYQALLDGLDAQGIRAAVASSFPFTRSGNLSTFEPRRSREQHRTMVRLRAVTPSYFAVTGLTANRGRVLAEDDVGSHLVVVNETLLSSVLPGGTDLGRRVGQEYEWTVVGVTRPTRQHRIDEEIRAEAYMLFDDLLQVDPTGASLALRGVNILAETPGGVPATLQIIRAAVADQMPEFTIRSAAPVMDLVRGHLGRERLVAAGAVVFAAVSLFLAALGLYARVSQGLALRGREIGIRIALGATVRRIALESARPVGLVYAGGVGVGTGLLLLTLSATRAVMVPPPGGAYPSLWALAAISAAVLLAAFAAACWRPIRAATRVEPADSLRAE